MKRLNSIDFNKKESKKEENRISKRDDDSLPNTLSHFSHTLPNTLLPFQILIIENNTTIREINLLLILLLILLILLFQHIVLLLLLLIV